MLQSLKISKQIRTEATVGKAEQFHKLHKHKAGTPTMGGGIMLFVIFFMVVLSFLIFQYRDVLSQMLGLDINYSLINRRETYLSLFTLATIGCLGFIDDLLNILGI